MAVYAQLANDLTHLARTTEVPPRMDSPCLMYNTEVLAGTVTSDRHREVTGWHFHAMDQLEYAWKGAVQLQTAEGRYLLPPQQAALIPAGTSHQTTVDPSIQMVSAFFQAGTINLDGLVSGVRVLAASALLREMVMYATRWPVDRLDHDDAGAATFFSALANVISEAVDDSTSLRLPTSQNPLVARAMAETEAQLPTATLASVAAAIGVSERTLRRRFAAVTGITWSNYVRQSRLLRAMALLSEPGVSVLEVASKVGFQSLSAFTRAFSLHIGETPTAYRRRVVE